MKVTMSKFDDQVYNLKEAIWHKRGQKTSYLLPADAEEAERRRKIQSLKDSMSAPDRAFSIGFFAFMAICLALLALR